MRIRKGDKVEVMSGKDRGKQAEVIRAIPSEHRVIVEGVHVAKRHAKPTRATMQGGDVYKRQVSPCLPPVCRGQRAWLRVPPT